MENEKDADAVFVIGTGSKNNNEELRYALRAMADRCPFIRDVYICGFCPDWVDRTKIKHLDWPDMFHHAKDANIIDKLLHACRHEGISDRILFCSDDQFPTRKVSWDDFRPRWLRQYSPDDGWYAKKNRVWHTRLRNTLERERKRREDAGLDPSKVYYYQPHMWMQIDRDKFIRYAEWCDYQHSCDTIIASGYMNFAEVEGVPDFGHIFISAKQKWPVEQTLAAYSDGSYASAMEYLRQEFREPCRFELSSAPSALVLRTSPVLSVSPRSPVQIASMAYVSDQSMLMKGLSLASDRSASASRHDLTVGIGPSWDCDGIFMAMWAAQAMPNVRVVRDDGRPQTDVSMAPDPASTVPRQVLDKAGAISRLDSEISGNRAFSSVAQDFSAAKSMLKSMDAGWKAAFNGVVRRIRSIRAGNTDPALAAVAVVQKESPAHTEGSNAVPANPSAKPSALPQNPKVQRTAAAVPCSPCARRRAMREARRKAEEEARAREALLAGSAGSASSHPNDEGCRECASGHLAKAVAYLSDDSSATGVTELALARAEIGLAAEQLLALKLYGLYNKCQDMFNGKADMSPDSLRDVLSGLSE